MTPVRQVEDSAVPNQSISPRHGQTLPEILCLLQAKKAAKNRF